MKTLSESTYNDNVIESSKKRIN